MIQFDFLYNLAVAQTCGSAGDLRLVGGYHSTSFNGTLEICSGVTLTWKWICSYNFGTANAKVACRQLQLAQNWNYSILGMPFMMLLCFPVSYYSVHVLCMDAQTCQTDTGVHPNLGR